MGRSTMNKDELVSMIAAAEGRNVPPTTEYQFAVEVPTTSKLTEEKARDALTRVLAVSMDPENPGWTLISGEAERKKSKRTKQRRRARINKRGY